ncbi:MAG: CCA tRNA nucleotidyltransferase [Deltaproteobacteria bacterium]|nr:MAG: CCA tRNA nucleotidyltransferase [Deltaproteobacteria bacterium]
MTPRAPAAPLRALPEAARPLVEAVLGTARREGYAVHLVGGPVRDLLRDVRVRDVDLIVETRQGRGAIELAQSAAPPNARVVAHGRFGTVRMELPDVPDGRVDLATVRAESYARPGALPEVRPATLEADLRRRDFTVNAMAIPLTPAARRGRPDVIDVEDGRRDLESHTLRVLHPRSFHDDPTRALRAARFAARLSFTLSRGSRSALRDALRDGVFGNVSGERFRREFENLFEDAQREGADPAAALRLLDAWHVLGALEPGLALPRPAVAPLRRLGRALAQPPWPTVRIRPWVAGLAVWLATLDPGLRGRALRRIAVRGEIRARIAGFRRERDAWLRSLARSRGRGAIDAVLSSVDEESLLALHASAPSPLRRRIARFASEDRRRRPPVRGDDLLAAGLSGPVVGRALARIRIEYLDGRVKTREEALAVAREVERRGRRSGPRKRS